MKNLIITIVFIFPFTGFCQDTSKSTGETLSFITNKLINRAFAKKKIRKIVICDFVDQRKRPTVTGSFVNDRVADYLTNLDSVIVLDRDHIDKILSEHKLKDKDLLIDKNAQLELGKFTGAEAIVVGKIMVYEADCYLQVNLKIIDANKAEALSSVDQEVQVDRKFADMTGLRITCKGSEVDAKPGKGYNRSVESNEEYNNTEKLKENGCEEKNTGDYYFFNSTSQSMTIYVYNSPIEEKNNFWENDNHQIIILKPGESKGISSLTAGYSYRFFVRITSDTELRLNRNEITYFDQGSIKIEKCESKTYTIKNAATTEVKKKLNGIGQRLLNKLLDKAVNKAVDKAEEKLKIKD
jgi:hypothetical protein